MTPREKKLARFTSSPAMTVLLSLMAGVGVWLSWLAGIDVMNFVADRGMGVRSPNLWFFGQPVTSLAVNSIALIFTAVMMVWANVRYTIIRSYNSAFAALFLVMTAAMPAVADRLRGGALLALVIVMAWMLIYSGYNSPRRAVRPVFMAFFLITAGALCQYGFLVYIPVFFMGLGQMQVMRFRTLTAAMLGIIAPLWLWWVFWPGEFPQLRLPELDNPFGTLTLLERIRFFVTVGVTLFLGLGLGAINLMRIYGYNAKARAVNGMITVTGVITGLAVLVDWTNMAFYMPLLSMCVAFQIGHFSHINAGNRSGYLTTLLVIAVYTALWVWNFIG